MERVDLLVKNVQVFNSYLKRFKHADVSILGDRIFYVDVKGTAPIDARSVIDGTGKYMIPGLVDIHMHIESSMMTPEPFCKRLAECGVTTIVAEPHEIANVKGIEGIRCMIEAGEQSVIDVYYGIPSSVPSTDESLETTGAVVDFEQMKALLTEERVICVGEIMNYRRIIRENDLEITKFLAYLRQHKPRYVIEGHCPSLTELDLAKFLYLGIDSDHTEHTMEELCQRFENGMFIEVQEKMLRPELLDYIRENRLYERFGFVTDDRMADELYETGHLDTIVRKAIALGMEPEHAIYGATYTNAMRMQLTDCGTIAPGKLADFCLLDDLASFRIAAVYKKGSRIDKRIVQSEAASASYRFPPEFYHSVRIKPLRKDDFFIPVPEDVDFVTVNVMEVQNGSTRTLKKEVRMPVENHRLKWQGSGCLLAMVFERYGKNGNIGYGFITGDCLKRGAVGTTYFHDHHNLFVTGDNEDTMRMTANRIIELQGGILTAQQGEIQAELALPVAGILSDKSVPEIGTSLKKVRQSLLDLGYCHQNPIMSLCTLGLPVSPELKLTDKGLVDVMSGRLERLYF